jgi:YggT family protein
MSIVCDLLQVYVLILVIRAVLSWFPIRPDSGLIPVLRALDTIINPVLMPLRRIIPPAGMFDLSYIALFIIIILIESVLCGSRVL